MHKHFLWEGDYRAYLDLMSESSKQSRTEVKWSSARAYLKGENDELVRVKPILDRLDTLTAKNWPSKALVEN